MNATQIEYFLTLCEYKNYSETARRLYVSQPTISKQIAALEEELGVKLFERTTNSLMLTMQGAIMKEAFANAVSIVKSAQTEAKNYHNRIADTIHIGILEGSGIGCLLMDSLSTVINQLLSDVDIRVSFLSYRELNTCLHKNTIDIGITLKKEIQNHTDLQHTKLRTLPFGIIAHSSLEIVKDGLLDLDRIHNLPFLFTRDGSLGIKEYLREQEMLLGLKPNQYHCVPNVDSILTNVELGLGFAISVSTPRVESNPDLEFFPLERQPLSIVAAWNRENENNSRNRIIKRMRRITIENGQF